MKSHWLLSVKTIDTDSLQVYKYLQLETNDNLLSFQISDSFGNMKWINIPMARIIYFITEKINNENI